MAKIKNANNQNRDENERLTMLVAERTRELEQNLQATLKQVEELKAENESRRGIEEELKQSEELFRNIFEYHTAVKLIIDPDAGNIIDANQAAITFYGWSKEQLKRMKIQEINMLSPQEIKQAMERAKTTKQNYFEFQHQLADGSVRDVEVFSSHITVKGKVLLHSIVHDVTSRKQAERAINLSEALLKRAELASKSGNWELSLDSQDIIFSEGAAKIYGIDQKRFQYSVIKKNSLPECRPMLDAALKKLIEEDQPYEIEFKIKTSDTGEIKDIHSVAQYDKEKRIIFGIIQDVTERRRAEEEIKMNEARLESLLRINQHPFKNIQGFLDFALDEAISLTGSKIGYIYFYDENKMEFTLNTWSKEVMQQCTVAEPQTIYQLDKTGIWGEAVRQRRPILVNDFTAPNPLKKGTPQGHAPLHKFLTIPVFSANQIVAVVGVANKPVDYNNSDIRQLNLMMDSVWKIVQRKRAEEALKESEAKFHALFSQMAEGFALHELIYDADKKAIDYRILEINPAFETQVGISAEKANGALASELYGVAPAPYLDIYARVAETGEHQTFQSYFPPLDRHFEISVFSPNPGYFATVFTDITERKRAEEALRKSEQRYRLIFDNSFDAFLQTAPDGSIQSANPATCQMFGRTEEEICRRGRSGIIDVTDPRSPAAIEERARTGKFFGELIGLRRDGTKFPIELASTIFTDDDGNQHSSMIIRDIAGRKQAEEKIQKLNRLYAVISQVNQAIVHLKDRDRLLAEVCRIAVELGGFQMAWIGLIDEETQLVKPQSVAGAEDGYLSVIDQISVSDNPQGRGPTGSAIREGKYYVCNDIENDSNMFLWKDEAVKRGYRSSISLPFRLYHKVIGSFSLYASQPHFFDHDEVKLLEEVAFDISYSLGTIETEKEHQKAVAALEESEVRFRKLAQSAPVGIIMTDKAQKVLFVSNVFSDMFGYTLGDIPDVEAWWPLAYPDVAYRESLIQVWGKAIEEVDAKGFIRPIEAIVTCKDGSKKNIECRLGSAGELNFVIFTDITERVKAQHDANERLKEISAFYKLAELTERKGISLDELFQEFTEILPNSWQYPEVTFARIIVEGKEFTTANFSADSKWVLKSPIFMNEQVAGSVEIGYLEERPDEDEGPFLKEERMLIDGLAERIGRITERKHVEDALRETKEYLENLINYANAPIIVWDNNLRITQFNKAFELLSGRNVSEVLGKEVDLLFPNDTKEQSLDYIKKTSAGERLNVVEIEIQHIEGSIHTLLWNSAAIYSPDGKTIVATVAQGNDITEQKLSLMALEESERRFRDMMEHVNMVSAMLDIHGNITFANDYLLKLTGWKEEEIIGRNWFDVFIPTNAAVRQDLFKGIDDETVPMHYENEILTRSGEVRLIHWSNTSLRNARGKVEGLAGIGIDITDRKNTEKALQESEASLRELVATKDRFFSIIAHDLRSPFNSILGLSDLLIEQIDEQDYGGVGEYARIIHDSSQRAMDLLMNLLEWSRSQTGRMEFSPEYIEMAALINEVAELLDDSAQQKSITVSRKLPRNILAFADKAMISTILRNLISNAIKFTHPGGQIAISAEPKKGEWMIAVSDSGVGIKKENLGKLFRIDESYSTYGTKNEKGTGLGLILCKEFVEKHGGRIWAESEPGKGSTFYFTIPKD